MLRANPRNKSAGADDEKDEKGLSKERTYGQRREAPLGKAQLPRRLPEGFETAIPPKKEDKA